MRPGRAGRDREGKKREVKGVGGENGREREGLRERRNER